MGLGEGGQQGVDPSSKRLHLFGALNRLQHSWLTAMMRQSNLFSARVVTHAYFDTVDICSFFTLETCMINGTETALSGFCGASAFKAPLPRDVCSSHCKQNERLCSVGKQCCLTSQDPSPTDGCLRCRPARPSRRLHLQDALSLFLRVKLHIAVL